MNGGNLQAEASDPKGKKGSILTYDQYIRIIESIVVHKALLDQQEVPLFLRNPSPDTTKNYKLILNEFG